MYSIWHRLRVDQPSLEVIARASDELGQDRRKSQTIVLASGAGAGLGVAMAVAGLPPQVWLLIIGLGLTFAMLFAISWRRTSAALKAAIEGPYRSVRVVGWCRPPDGCNLGLFWSEAAAEPDAVVRLPIVRNMTTTDGWVAGDTTPSRGRAVAVIDKQGALLGAGRIVSAEAGRGKWSRRQKAPSRWVMQPPGTWRPPR